MIKKTIPLFFCTLCSCHSVLSTSGAKEVAHSAVTDVSNSLDKETDKLLDYLKSLKLDELSNRIADTTQASANTIEEIGKLSQSLKENSETLNALLKKAEQNLNPDDLKKLVSDVQQSIDGIKTLVGHVNESAEKIPALVDGLQKTVDTTNKILAHVESVVAKVNGSDSVGPPVWAYFISAIIILLAAVIVIALVLHNIHKKKI